MASYPPYVEEEQGEIIPFRYAPNKGVSPEYEGIICDSYEELKETCPKCFPNDDDEWYARYHQAELVDGKWV